MKMWWYLINFGLLSAIIADNVEYSFITKYIDVPVDHFSYTSNLTFKLKYLINDTNHVRKGPIFLYTGNEGDIEMFAQNTGFMFDIAPQFNALIVFIEHRYYGSSLPFGNLSYTSPKYLGYLSAGQALSDFVYVIGELQKTFSVSKDLQNLPVVAFGGSYGGMLSAWLRMKYPSSVIGAIASSAPIWQFQGLTPCENFYRVTTNVYQALGSEKCSGTIRKSWNILRTITKNATGKATVSKLWNLCTPLATQDNIEDLVSWLSEIYVNLAMVNYPYPTSFLTNLPAYPVREFCGRINNFQYTDDIGVLTALGKAMDLYTNYTGTTKCNDYSKTSDTLGEAGWNFQACTEMIMPICSNNLDMFEDEKWDFEKYTNNCKKKSGVKPWNEEVPILEYGGRNLKPYSNIVFSNGLFDPWSSGGVLSNITSTVLATVIPDGAHHFDLRGTHSNDSESVKSARLFHVREIEKWLNEYYSEHSYPVLKSE